MLHKSKGVYRFQNKATFNVEQGLSPIILAYLKQLLKAKDSDGFGVPQYYMRKQAEVMGVESWCDADFEEAAKLRIKDIKELIWAFSQTCKDEPDMEAFGLSFNRANPYSFQRVEGEDGAVRFKIAEREVGAFDSFNVACDLYTERKEAAYRLFGEVYSTLDW